MINFIEGTVSETGEGLIVVKCGPIGYETCVSAYTLASNGKIGAEIKLLTHLAVRDDGLTLYGFNCREEKAMFLRLITVSGIGPKLALSVLSGIPLSELAAAVAGGNIATLNRIKGVGKKTAERIILELKDKITGEFAPVGANSLASSEDDAVLALISMGFTRQEAESAVKKVNGTGLTTEQIVVAALKSNNR